MSRGRPDHLFIKLPIELAPAWHRLSVLARGIGGELFRMYQETVIELSLDDAEDVIVRMVGPDPSERKAVRHAIRLLIERGLLVAVEGGIRLLYSREAYRAHYAHAAPTVPQPHADSASKVPGPSGDGAPTTPQPHAEGAPTVGANAAKPQEPVAQIDREKERKREGASALAREIAGLETQTSARANGLSSVPRETRELTAAEQAELDRIDPPDEESEAVRVRELLERGYKARYTKKLAAPPPVIRAHEDAARRLTQWVLDAARARNMRPERLIEQLLGGFFASSRAAEAKFKITWLAQEPLEFLPASQRPLPPRTDPEVERRMREDFARDAQERAEREAAARAELAPVKAEPRYEDPDADLLAWQAEGAPLTRDDAEEEQPQQRSAG